MGSVYPESYAVEFKLTLTLLFILLIAPFAGAEYQRISFQDSPDSGGDTVVVCPTNITGFTHEETFNCGMVDPDVCASMFNSQEAVDDSIDTVSDDCYVVRKPTEDEEVEITDLSGNDVAGSTGETSDTDEQVSLNGELEDDLRKLILESDAWEELATLIGNRDTFNDAQALGNIAPTQQQGEENSEGALDVNKLMQLLPLLAGSNNYGQGAQTTGASGGAFSGGGQNFSGGSNPSFNPGSAHGGGQLGNKTLLKNSALVNTIEEINSIRRLMGGVGTKEQTAKLAELETRLDKIKEDLQKDYENQGDDEEVAKAKVNLAVAAAESATNKKDVAGGGGGDCEDCQ